ncbi:hypothetical protein C8R45DRAFT_475970 [Mycena sanguinolenta]|nr:hypothetical protein C8R45DRAFT_475970 [Mycena sanguinolenta]
MSSWAVSSSSSGIARLPSPFHDNPSALSSTPPARQLDLRTAWHHRRPAAFAFSTYGSAESGLASVTARARVNSSSSATPSATSSTGGADSRAGRRERVAFGAGIFIGIWAWLFCNRPMSGAPQLIRPCNGGADLFAEKCILSHQSLRYQRRLCVSRYACHPAEFDYSSIVSPRLLRSPSPLSDSKPTKLSPPPFRSD